MSNLIVIAVCAALAVGVPFAAEVEVEAKGSQRPAEIIDPLEENTTFASEEPVLQAAAETSHAIQRSNKASNLIGMEVRNPNNEKLGEIKDVVLDLPNGSLSYAVLAVGGFLGVGEKLLAVPPNAFALSADGTHLLLNADKAKIAAASGFPATNWPDPRAPRNEGFWLAPVAASGAPARSESAADSRTDARSETTPPRSGETVATPSITGDVRAVDTDRDSILLQTQDGETRQVRVNDRTKIAIGQGAVVKLEALKPGFQVRIEYQEQGGELVARQVTKLD